MQLPTVKDRFLQLLRPAKAGDANDTSSHSAQSWPAPASKPSALVLKKPPVVATDFPAPPGRPMARVSVAPFPAPARADAFELPRPAMAVGASSPWFPRAPKSDALTRAATVSAGGEFPRPNFGEKKSARHPGGLCRTC